MLISVAAWNAELLKEVPAKLKLEDPKADTDDDDMPALAASSSDEEALEKTMDQDNKGVLKRGVRKKLRKRANDVLEVLREDRLKEELRQADERKQEKAKAYPKKNASSLNASSLEGDLGYSTKRNASSLQ